MSVFHRSYIGRQKVHRLAPAASVALIAALSAALWAMCIFAAVALWSMV